MPVDNQDELFYHVDEHDSEIGSITRAQAHDGTHKIHRSIIVILVNNDDEMLLQKRSMKKDKEPGLWSCAVGGHLSFGQSYEEAAERETREELGIDVPLQKLQKILIHKDFETEYSTIFKAEVAGRIELSADPTEVESTQWVPISQLQKFIDENPTTSWTFQALKETSFI